MVARAERVRKIAVGLHEQDLKELRSCGESPANSLVTRRVQTVPKASKAEQRRAASQESRRHPLEQEYVSST